MDDFSVSADVRSGRRVVDEFCEVRKAARVGFETCIAQRLSNRQRVGGAAALDHCGDMFIDDLVVAAVEVIGLNDVNDAVKRVVVDHQAAQNGLLAVDALRRSAHGLCGGVVNYVSHLCRFILDSEGEYLSRIRMLGCALHSSKLHLIRGVLR